MVTDKVLSFQQCFEVVEDPRVAGRCDHRLDSVLLRAGVRSANLMTLVASAHRNDLEITM